MEKIQSAIAKARATRDGQVLPEEAAPVDLATPATAPFEAKPATPPAPSSVEAAWRALGTVQPALKQMQRSHVVTYEGGRDAVPFDVMRTRLLQQMRANNWRRLAITSPGAACGKSTTCLNLGFSLARQSDMRILVAEVDLRRPSLAQTLGIRVSQSFSEVLAGTVPLAGNAVRYGANLAFATNKGPVRNPAELLHSPSVEPALAAIEAQYDPSLIIFDMPPLLVNDDAIAFMRHVDCVLLVAAAETTTIQEVDICERDLAAQTSVLGVVLNKCRFTDRRYGYSYYS
jgi:protein-tyrosine kinase